MNERIQQLMIQATVREPYYPAGNDGHPEYRIYVNQEMFAELLIKECMDRVDRAGSNFNEQPQYTNRQNALVSEGFFWGLESVKQQVKEHFGLEQ